MEKSLSTNSLKTIVSHYSEFKDAVQKTADSDSQKKFTVSGLKGSLPSFFTVSFLERLSLLKKHALQYEGRTVTSGSDIFIICATEKDADECETDLQALLEDDTVILKFPWWGTVPCRPTAKGSVVFGKRAGVLSKLCMRNRNGKNRIIILTQRSVMSPVPPKDYLKKHILEIRKGQTVSIEELSNRLSSQGYLRVPRVQVRGEFAVRGEVLDVFLCDEPFALRLVFDFDTVEQIKLFDVETQSSRKNLESAVLYPKKEIVWNDELVSKLEKLLENENSGIKNDFASYDFAKHNSGQKAAVDDAGHDIQKNVGPDALNNAQPDLRSGGKNERSVVKSESDVNERSDRYSSDAPESPELSKEPGVPVSASSEAPESSQAPASSEAPEALASSENNGAADSETQTIHLSLTEEALKASENLLTELSVTGESEGEELFYGLLFEKKSCILDYAASDSAVFCFEHDRLMNACKLLEKEYESAYRTSRLLFPVPRRTQALLDFEELLNRPVKTLFIKTLSSEDDEEEIRISSEAPLSFFGNINYLREQLSSLMQSGYRIFVFADNENQALRINEILKDFSNPQKPGVVPLCVLPDAVSKGFSIPEAKILVIQENEIFGRRKSVPKSIRKAKSKAIDTFVELKPGDYVVHVNYGIGLFKGIERVKSMGTERDYIKIEYAGEEFAFVPIEQVNLVQRYIGDENSHPRLDTIGSKSWASRKARVQQKVEEIANRLIDLYSKRKASRGFAFPKDTEWSAAFEAAFPYEDTPDQAEATVEIKSDMEKDVPMDRLLCGDVGYGKTELAMRAAFKAVMGGKQVAFLAPTTILAEQHFESCTERFRNFPVKIAQLSRFVSPSEQKKTLSLLEEGKVDVLVGTHRILQKDVHFRDLGLLIIDEEQRFGVKDKERLKEIKHNIDCLALSATPIPRTLHMSLLKIRDMSLLTTPPQNRQSVETVIEAFSDDRVARAVRAEVARGGQVFYLHNRVETLEETRLHLEKILPEMMIDTAHGKMSADELDDIFRRFKMGGFHVLVSTTIIENGIDIPNVNTIIIDRSDMYGISQLYQLRGRVGRSDRKAYAYLLYPENKALSEVAMKRLQVISDFTELGSGFKIAMKDMEIRGAGNLLGKDQSGEVYAVGFEMYLNLLNAAIERLSSENWHEASETLLELEYTGFIPDSYIEDAQIKMEMYKKIASIKKDEEIDAVYGEMFDRFGPIPDEVNSLLNLAKIRIICNELNVISLKEKRGVVAVEFDQKSPVSIDRIMTLISTGGGRVRLDSSHPSTIFMKTESIDLKVKSDFIREKLLMLRS